MEKKLPITSKEAAALLAKFIAKNWQFCPVDENCNIPECDGWTSERCEMCLRRHAEYLEGAH